MRIAYVVHYQSPGFTRQRPCLHNLSLGCRVKVELIAASLKASGHDVEILSQGEVDQNQFKYYPFYREEQPFDPDIPILYASALPVKYITGVWSANSTLRLLKARNKIAPFDVVIIQTLKTAQIACTYFAKNHLKIPVILQYEDDSFSDVVGKAQPGLKAKYHRYQYRKVLRELCGCVAVSPYLLSQLPAGIPKLLLRGVVNRYISDPQTLQNVPRKNRAVFSGTHEGAQGLDQMVAAWKILKLPDWELHIAGQGPITGRLKEAAAGVPSIVFHGLLNQEANGRLICSARIGMNPQDPTETPGTSFAFKIIEYLAGGLHVITTPRGELEPELEKGITYIQQNSPEAIAASLRQAIDQRRFDSNVREATLQIYGAPAITKSLNRMLVEVVENMRSGGERPAGQPAFSKSALAR